MRTFSFILLNSYLGTGPILPEQTGLEIRTDPGTAISRSESKAWRQARLHTRLQILLICLVNCNLQAEKTQTLSQSLQENLEPDVTCFFLVVIYINSIRSSCISPLSFHIFHWKKCLSWLCLVWGLGVFWKNIKNQTFWYWLIMPVIQNLFNRRVLHFIKLGHKLWSLDEN